MDGSTAVWHASCENATTITTENPTTHYCHKNSSSFNNNNNNNHEKALQMRRVSFSPGYNCLCSSISTTSSTLTTMGQSPATATRTPYKHRKLCGTNNINDIRIKRDFSCKCLYYYHNSHCRDRPRCLSFATEWLVWRVLKLLLDHHQTHTFLIRSN